MKQNESGFDHNSINTLLRFLEDGKDTNPAILGIEVNDDTLLMRPWWVISDPMESVRHTISVGNVTYYKDSPVKHYVPEDNAGTPAEIMTRCFPDYEPYDHTSYKTSSNVPEKVMEAIKSITDERAAEACRIIFSTPDEEEEKCSGCDGTGRTVGECSCVFLGATRTVDLSEDDDSYQPVNGKYPPDENCSECSGAGVNIRACYQCGATGVIPQGYSTVLTMPDGSITTIPGEVRDLIPMIDLESCISIYGYDDWAKVHLQVSSEASIPDFDTYSVWAHGKAMERVQLPVGQWTMRIEDIDSMIEGCGSLEEITAVIGEQFPSPEEIAETLMKTYRHQRTRALSWMSGERRRETAEEFGYTLDEREVIIGQSLSLSLKPTVEEVLRRVVKDAENQGLYPVMSMAFIETGISGPAITYCQRSGDSLEAVRSFEPSFDIITTAQMIVGPNES